MRAFPARLPCQMSSSSVVVRVSGRTETGRACYCGSCGTSSVGKREAGERSPTPDLLQAAVGNGGYLEEGVLQVGSSGNKA